MIQLLQFVILIRAVSSPIFFSIAVTKKGGRIFCFVTLVYGCFLVTRIASTTPMTIMTMIMATPMYMRPFCVAKPLTGVAEGAVVAEGAPA